MMSVVVTGTLAARRFEELQLLYSEVSLQGWQDPGGRWSSSKGRGIETGLTGSWGPSWPSRNRARARGISILGWPCPELGNEKAGIRIHARGPLDTRSFLCLTGWR